MTESRGKPKGNEVLIATEIPSLNNSQTKVNSVFAFLGPNCTRKMTMNKLLLGLTLSIKFGENIPSHDFTKNFKRILF